LEQIIDKLHELKEKLNQLKNLNYREGSEDYESIKQLLERIIDRTYPEKDAQDLKIQLDAFSRARYEAERQNLYLKGITNAVRVIDTILDEYELFGFDDFKPVKEKVETEFKVGIKDFVSYGKKKTK